LTVSTGLTLSAAPNSLQFSAQQLGPQAAPQTVRIADGGSAIPISVSTSAGATWLTVTGAGTTPADLTVSVSTGNLSPGTYSALILVQSPLAANNPLQIPVTLTVSAAEVLSASPASLRFSYTIGGVKPQPQSFALASGRTPVPYSYSVVPGPLWLYASGSGNTSGTATVAVDPGVLTPGEYQGTIQVSSPSTGNVAAVNVILTVSATPIITVQPAQLIFAYQIGGQLPVNQSLVVRSGSDVLNVTAAVQTLGGGNWLHIAGGGNTPAPFSVSVDPAGLAPGNYQEQITISSPDSPSTPVVIPVSLTVTTAPVLVSLPNVLFFAVQSGTGAPPNRQITVVSSDGTALPVTAQPSAGASWLTITGNSTTTPAVFTVTVNPDSLSIGQYLGSIVLSSPGSGAGSQLVTVTLDITGQPSLSANPGALSFSAAPSSSPAPISVGITADSPVTFTAAPGPGAPWLSVNGSGTTPSAILVSVNAVGLAPGSYHAAVFVTSPGAGNSPLAIPVEFLVSSAPLLTAAPSSLTLLARGTSTTSLTISSTVPGVQFAAAASPATPWLRVTATGTTPAGLTVTADATGLTPGTYQGAVQITASGISNSPLLVPITFVITSAPVLGASPSPLHFTYDSSGLLPSPQAINLALDGQPIANAEATVAPGTPWLTLGQASGSTISAVANPSGLLPGTYTASVQVTASGAGNSPLTIPVSFTVTGFPPFDISQTGLAFAVLSQQNTPVSTTVVIGSSAPPADIQLDVTGSTWLSASPMQGRTPLPVTFTISPADLRPGNYAGSVVILSGGAKAATLPVNLLVSPQTEFSVSPQFLEFNYFQGGNLPDPANVYYVRFGETRALTASSSDPWITVNPSVPSLTGPISISVNPAGLASGTHTGSVTLTATDPDTGAPLGQRLVPVEFYINEPADPRITAIANGMSFLSTTLAPGLIFSIFGTGLGPNPPQTAQLESTQQTFARSLGGVQVLVNGIACPVLYVSETQINAIAPYALYTKDSATVAVRHNGILSAEVPLSVNPASSGVFGYLANGIGQGAILNQDQSINASSNPADKGSIVSIFGGGEGQTAPQGIDGLAANGTPLPKPILPVTVFVGGIPATDITYAGAAPTLTAGVLQVNVRIPANAPSGDVSVVVVVGDTASQQGLTVSIR
jgi:uncharacterized protein (TIGR03437 family)